MKKFLAVIACFVLAVTTFALTACGDNSSEGTIPGNYKEATDEEIAEAIGKIGEADFSSLKGLEISLNAETSMTGLMSLDAEASVNYQVVWGDSLAGKGSASLSAKMVMGEVSQDYDISADIYNDDTYAYVNAKGLPVEGMSDLKAKVDLEEVVGGMLGGFMGGYALADEYVAVQVPGMMAYLELVQDACTIALDTSDGVKVKLSLDENGLWKILEEIQGAETVAQMKASLSFEKLVCEVYFAIDADGKFAGVASNINIKATAKANTTTNSTTNQTVEMSLTLSVSEYTGSVTLPSGIATDSSYLDMTSYFGNQNEQVPDYNYGT